MGIFTGFPQFFIVQAASPRPNRVRWAKKAGDKRFYMKRWSFSEVLQAHVDPYHGRFTMLTFSAAVRSLGRHPSRNTNSGICTTSLGHPPGSSSKMPVIQPSMNLGSSTPLGLYPFSLVKRSQFSRSRRSVPDPRGHGSFAKFTPCQRKVHRFTTRTRTSLGLTPCKPGRRKATLLQLVLGKPPICHRCWVAL